MKRLFFLLIVLIIAILIGIQLKSNPGYVLITTNHFTIETRLWFVSLFLLILFLMLYFVIRLFKYIYSMPIRWQQWRTKEKTSKATKLTYQGLMSVAQGDWSIAQKKLLREIKNAPVPLINYLAAATAAAGDGEQQQRDQYLHQAYEIMPNAKLIVGLVQAQLQYDASQYELALATLKQLVEIAPKQKLVLRLLTKVYQKLGEWNNLVKLLPQLKKRQLFSERYLINITLTAYCHIFTKPCDVEGLMKAWKKAPSDIRNRPQIIKLYIEALINLNEIDTADALLRKVLKEDWNSELVLLYADIKLTDVKRQLAYAEHWLRFYPKDVDLLFVLGKLAERNQLWGKAKNYYQASLKIEPKVSVYAVYAKLLEQLGEVEESLIYYRLGLLATVQ